MPFDLDSIEDTMNRRMRTIWVRHATFLTILGFIAVVGLIVLTVFDVIVIELKGHAAKSAMKSEMKSEAK